MKKIFVAILLGLFLSSVAQASTATESKSTAAKQLDVKQQEVEQLLAKGNKAWSEQKMEQAELDFRKAIDLDYNSARAHAILAGLLHTLNRGDEAIEEYQTAITLDSENAKLFIALSIAYLHQQSYAMAAAMADEAVRLDPEMANANKLVEYIDAKQDVVKAASATEITDENAGQIPATGKMPAGHPVSEKSVH